MENICKICNNDNLELIYNINLKDISYIYDMGNINIVSCNNCGFCFNNKISQNDCNEYYSKSNNYTNDLYRTQLLQHDRYNHFKNLLKELNINNDDSIIDLTASDGSLLLYLEYLGYNNLTYCDISELNVNNFNYKNKYKLNIIDSNDYNFINKKYKLIILSHTLEHLSDLKNIFENIKILMDEESFLYIEVPDMNRIKCNNNAFLELTHEHINFFNLNSLNNLCNKNNLININSGILDFKYRLNLSINAFYGVYKINNKLINNYIFDDISKINLKKYIKNSEYEMSLIYNKIDNSIVYSLVGVGLYSLYFINIHKDIKINNFYDDVKIGTIQNIPIKKIKEIKDNEKILILTPCYYDKIYENLIKNNINPNNIIKLYNKN